jgi:hypothetical protein
VISSNGKSDRPAESLEVKAPIGQEPVRSAQGARKSAWRCVIDGLDQCGIPDASHEMHSGAPMIIPAGVGEKFDFGGFGVATRSMVDPTGQKWA